MNWLRLALALVVVGVMNGCVADPVGRFTFSVKDDEGTALPDIKVCIAGHKGWVPGPSFGRDEFRSKEGVTDTNGMLTLEIASDQGHFEYTVQRLPDYYDFYARDLYLTEKKNDQWMPWDRKIEIIMAKKGKPIVMYAKKTSADEKSKLNYNNINVGYDLMIGDWIDPYGKGKVADFFVKFEHDIISENDYLHTMTIRFPNDGDGLILQPVPIRERNDLVLSRFAPENGYQSLYIEQQGVKNNKSIYTAIENDNFFIRTRTVKKDGKIISCNYGKIIGCIEGSNSNFLCMRYFLNPNQNDRNLEVDRSDNLIKHLEKDDTSSKQKE